MVNYFLTSKKLIPTVFIPVTRIRNAYLAARKAEKKVQEFENHIFSTFNKEMEVSKRLGPQGQFASVKSELRASMGKAEIHKVHAISKARKDYYSKALKFSMKSSIFQGPAKLQSVDPSLGNPELATRNPWEDRQWQIPKHYINPEFSRTLLIFYENKIDKIRLKALRLNDLKLKGATQMAWCLEAERQLAKEWTKDKNAFLSAPMVVCSHAEKETEGIYNFHDKHNVEFHWSLKVKSSTLKAFVDHVKSAFFKVCKRISILKIRAFAALRARACKLSTGQPSNDLDLKLPQESVSIGSELTKVPCEIEREPSTNTNWPYHSVNHEFSTKECFGTNGVPKTSWDRKFTTGAAIESEPVTTVEDDFVMFSRVQSHASISRLQDESITEGSEKNSFELNYEFLRIPTRDCAHDEWTDELNSKPELTPEEGDLFFSFLSSQAQMLGRPVDGECWKLYAFKSPTETKQLQREAIIMAGIADAVEHDSLFSNYSKQKGGILPFSGMTQKPFDKKPKKKTKGSKYAQWWEARSCDENCIGVKEVSPTAVAIDMSTLLRETESSASSVERHLHPRRVQFPDYHDPEDIIPQIYGTRMFSYVRMFDKWEPPNAVRICESLQKRTLPLKSCLKQSNPRSLQAA